MQTILHVLEKQEWESALANGFYAPKSLKTDKFIHCSTKTQVVNVANFLYRGQKELVLLYIDPDKVHSEIIYEDLYEAGELYPHIYGSLNTDAVLKAVSFSSDSDGKFHLPK